MSQTPYGFRLVGDCTGQRRLVDHALAFAAYASCDAKAEVDSEAYLSAFTFGGDFREHLEQTGSTRGFAGECSAPVLWFDIDCADDLPRAQEGAGRLATTMVERFGIAPEVLLLFFSGSKGFHIGLPCYFWTPAPAADFNKIARRFCENVAIVAGVGIDVSVYDKVRAFRAPNSRHPKTGLYKHRLTLDDLLHLPIADVLTLAKGPAPFEIPSPAVHGDCSPGLIFDWLAAREEVRTQTEARASRQAADNGTPTLNRLTMDFIRNGADTGDRHRLLFSAAANLMEFGCPPALAHALLTESGLDSGLSPSDVRRQIDCGLKHTTGGSTQ